MCSLLGREQKAAKECEEVVGLNENAHYLDCGDSFTVHICVKIHEIVHWKYLV